jgi:bacteriocin-like protein
MVMKTLTPEEMQQISGGVQQQGGGFFPELVARLILGSLFFDFGADGPRLVKNPQPG